MGLRPIDPSQNLKWKMKEMDARIEVVRGDITTQAVDAIVNAANEGLLGGGGVDGAIHRAAGPQLLEACRSLGGCPAGEARITEGFRLPTNWVIHTVGPVWRGGENDERKQLSSCYRTSLALARQTGCRTVAFPAISCGIYGFPLADAARVSLDAVREELSRHDLPHLVRWVMFDESAFWAWNQLLAT